MASQITKGHYILLFDGVCNFCNTWVKFVYKRDPQKLFRFQPIQSRRGMELLDEYKHLKPPKGLNSVILIDEKAGKLYSYSDAVAQISRQLPFPWNAIYYLRQCVPGSFANFLYIQFAKRRYQWFGKKDTCSYVPDLRNRFVEWNSPQVSEEEVFQT